jgi:hypothetical protein
MHAKAVDQLDFRFEDPRNCLAPGVRRERLPVSSPMPSEWTVRDVESIHAQFFLDVGHGPKDLRAVRLSQCGVHYWRLRQQEVRPTHRYSWMRARDDVRKGRNSESFLSSSSGPSFITVDNSQDPATLALFGHKDFSTPLRPTALVFIPASQRTMVFDLDPVPIPARSPSPPAPAGEVDPILSLDPDYLRQCSDQEAEDFLASFTLDPIPEDGSSPPSRQSS